MITILKAMMIDSTFCALALGEFISFVGIVVTGLYITKKFLLKK